MSANTYDIENFLKDSLALVQADLTTRVTELDTEKGDFILDPINPDAYFHAHIPKMWDYNIGVVYGVLRTAPVDIHEINMLRRVNIFFEILVTDDGDVDAQGVQWRLLRYMRALEKVFQKAAPQPWEGFLKLKVNALLPQTFGVNDHIFRSSGVEIEGVWASN